MTHHRIGPYFTGPTTTEWFGIYEGDSVWGTSFIPDNSIDAMICDPVYQNIWQYQFIAELADRVLKPGRSLIAQAGNIHAFEAEQAMFSPGLVRRPRLNEVFTGGFGRNWMHKAFRTYQPYLWATKALSNGGDYNWSKLYHKWVRLSFYGSRDKGAFVWGDGERAYAYLVETFTRPGDVILDPFSGTGTVAAVAAKLGRRYLSFELEPYRCAESRVRLSKIYAAQIAMFDQDMNEPTPEELEQMEMFE